VVGRLLREQEFGSSILPSPTTISEEVMVTQFQTRLQEAVRAGLQRDLATEFEVAESTVWRWSEGTAKPHPKVQALVVEYLKEHGSVTQR